MKGPTQAFIPKAPPTATISVLVLMRHWLVSESEQAQLLALTQSAVVQELILVEGCADAARYPGRAGKAALFTA